MDVICNGIAATIGPKDSPTILFVQRSSQLNGSAFSGLLLANGMRAEGWKTHVAFGYQGPIIERYRRGGHRTHIIPHDNWLRRGRAHQFVRDIWTEWRNADAFESLIEEVQPRVVYVNTVVSLAGAIAARRTGCACVWHLREMFSNVGGEMNAPTWAVSGIRFLIREQADQLVANSVATARNLLGPKTDDVAVIPNAVRASFFDEGRSRSKARRDLGLKTEGPIIGVPGSLRPMKGHTFFFKAIAPLLQKREGLRVAVTGEGTDAFTNHLRKQVQRLGIQDQVSFLGWVEDMPGFYRACDVVCIPSRAEPFGRTAIEAFAVGTPVVASEVGGLKEIVTDGETGFLVGYGDEETLATSVGRLLDVSELRRKMSSNARQVAGEKYNEKEYTSRIESLVDGVLTNHEHISQD